MYETVSTTVIDLTPYLLRSARERARDALYTVLALWTQYLAIGVLGLYGLLRLLLYPEIPAGCYTGPLALLWAASFFLLLTSYVSDLVLWREEE